MSTKAIEKLLKIVNRVLKEEEFKKEWKISLLIVIVSVQRENEKQ